MQACRPFGDYVVYVDESGDHSLVSIHKEFPLFVLAFCVFRKTDYVARVVPAAQRFKFAHFGHDIVVLHERAIRKAAPPFDFLTSAERRASFMDGLNDLVAEAPFTIVAVVINKQRLLGQHSNPDNPYHIALERGLERLCQLLRDRGQGGRTTHVVVECRGAKEDTELATAFRQTTCDTSGCADTPLALVFSPKQANSTGLQLADLVARPIGRTLLAPGVRNRAYQILEEKFRRGPEGQIEAWGLTCVP